MGKFKVNSNKEAELERLMTRLGIFEADLVESFIKGGGPGGQKINKSASCVYLKHLPSGFEVKCQATRSLALNRYLARKELCSRIEERILGRESQKRQAIEKIKRQKRKRSKRAKEKMLKAKKSRSNLKSLRGRVGEE